MAICGVAFTPKVFIPEVTKVVPNLNIVDVGLETELVRMVEGVTIIEPLGPARPGFEDDGTTVEFPGGGVPGRRRPVDIQDVLIDYHGGTVHPAPVVFDDIRVAGGDLGFEIFTGGDVELAHTGVQEIVLGITVLSGEHHLGNLGIP